MNTAFIIKVQKTGESSLLKNTEVISHFGGGSYTKAAEDLHQVQGNQIHLFSHYSQRLLESQSTHNIKLLTQH